MNHMNPSTISNTTRQSLSIQQAENNDTTTSNNNSKNNIEYHDQSSNDLTLFTGALLLTADCMGTGILALPSDVQCLGTKFGIAFLLLNLPINLYAGTILSRCALFVEGRILGGVQAICNNNNKDYTINNVSISGDDEQDVNDGGLGGQKQDNMQQQRNRGKKKGYSSVDGNDDNNITIENDIRDDENDSHHNADTATFDFIGMTSMLFDEPIQPATEIFEDVFDTDFSIDDDDDDDDEDAPQQQQHKSHRQITYKHSFTKVVLAIYYVNLFLVLGNYILVMSHAVAAMAGDHICIPTAGLIASTLMFALSQLNTMANLGRSVSAVSLICLLIVVVQCLMSLQNSEDETKVEKEEQLEYTSFTTAETALAKMSSLASIGFAVGSQKLLLNIRHEMADRTKAPGALGLSLSIYGAAYTVVCLLAGSNSSPPPSFLFDAIPDGVGRRIAGLLLWIHVAVSYAINSQAFCSSTDRLIGHRVKFCGLNVKHRLRWMLLTLSVAITSYVVANGIPFFKDLVALCGALTSIPLSLLIPAIFYRRVQNVPLCFPTINSKTSFMLVWFSIVFMIIGLIGAIGSIDVDWLNRSGPFTCH